MLLLPLQSLLFVSHFVIIYHEDLAPGRRVCHQISHLLHRHQFDTRHVPAAFWRRLILNVNGGDSSLQIFAHRALDEIGFLERGGFDASLQSGLLDEWSRALG